MTATDDPDEEHSGPCTDSNPCNTCTNAAERAEARWHREYWGGSDPVTVQEQYDRAAKEKRR